MCELANSLAKLKHLCQNGRVSEHTFYEIAHPLAEKRYEPLRVFLIEMLESPNATCRLNAVHLLGGHWHEKPDIGEKLVELLTNDPNDDIRYVESREILHQCANDPKQASFVKESCVDAIRVLDGTSQVQILREQLNQIGNEGG